LSISITLTIGFYNCLCSTDCDSYTLLVTTTVNVCYLCYDIIVNHNKPTVAQDISAISRRIFVLSGAIAAHPFDFYHATCVHYATHVHIAVYIMYGVSVRLSAGHMPVLCRKVPSRNQRCVIAQWNSSFLTSKILVKIQ